MVLFHGSREIVRFPEVKERFLIKIFISVFIVLFIRNRQNGGRPDMGKRDM